MKSKVEVYDDVPSVVTVVHNGEIYTALAGQHVNFNLILACLATDNQDEKVLELFDVERTVATAFERVTSHITVRNGEVYYDGDVLHNGVSKQILRFVEEGLTDRLTAVANFAEKVMTNPQEHSRDQLFTWLDRHDFTITESGDFVGYKGCSNDNGVPVSTRPAPESDGVTRNGVPVIGERVKNVDGDVIEMPRSKVDFNAGVGCSNGLHVGTYSYASSFAPVLLEVHVDPRDVVSVPTDCDAQKIRTCRYTVVGPIEREYAEAVLPYAQVVESDEVDDEFEDEPECGGCSDFDLDLNEDGLCLDCAIEAAVEEVEETFQVADVTKAEPWDTRLNYTKQERYPAGHAKAGQFVPRSA